MAEGCVFCDLIRAQNVRKLYEDEYCVAILEPAPAALGHILVMPKHHYPIFEQVPDFIVASMFSAMNKISTVLFDRLRAHGTNVLITNGIAAGQEAAHVMVNLIPRREGDGLNFQWQPKQLSEEEMNTSELQLKEECKKIGDFQREKAQAVVLDQKPLSLGAISGDSRDGKTEHDASQNYMLRRLRRIP
ncbi:MAG TPA: HIT family protein [Candidatus Nanoarchaeia archaeon]|nr:HIT family protein [Candidatus Nanoarchaeia archaeon]